MGKNTVDCCNMTCPAPVITVRDILDKERPKSLDVIVDNEAAYQNVRRFLEYSRYSVTHRNDGNRIILSAFTDNMDTSKPSSESISFPEIICDALPGKSVVILVTSNRIGHGDDDLGEMLMFNFLKTAKELGDELKGVYFVNSGVKFAVEGSDALPLLSELEESGVKIRSCGACLGYFHLLDKLAAGEVTNMLEIVTAMKESDKVITV